ncbi:MAG: S8 family serine peptidase [Rhodoferax sp.]|nr:S8 family serine peptidase [Actinomycetota bacterium]
MIRRQAVLGVALLVALPVTAGPGAGLAAASGSTSLPAASTARSGPAATAVIVRWKGGVSATRQAQALARQDLHRTARLPLVASTDVVAVPAGSSAERTARELEADPKVAYAEPDYRLTPTSADPGFPAQWGLANTGQTVTVGTRSSVGTAGVDLGAPAAWAALAGASTAPVTVAVLDTGMDFSHPDLAGHVWTNPGEIPGNGIDDDRNGYVDDVHGWDFQHGDPTVYDDPSLDRHGTHVGGIIGAVRDNGTGVAGVADNVRLLPLKFLGADGGATSDAIRAIAYADAAGARIINASWGGPEYSQALRDAMAASPALFITAAGNGGSDGIGDDDDLIAEYPTSYRLPNEISVAAVTNTGALASWSNYGPISVALGAPGQDIVSTVPGGLYGYLSGTSMAAPMVSGVAALVAQARPSLSAAGISAVLRSTARPLPALAGKVTTGAVVDAAAAVAAALALPSTAPAGPAPLPPPPPPPTIPSPAPPPTPPQPVLACPVGLPDAGFTDVAGDVHAAAISCAAWWGVVHGRTASTYDPSGLVSRGQAASLLAGVLRAAGRLPVTAADRFTDDDGNVHEANINALASLGIISGTSASTYAPGRSVTRGQLASLVVATGGYLTRTTLGAGPTPFTDIGTDVHAGDIAKAYTAGLMSGTSATTVAPGRSAPRDQAAPVLARELQVLVAAGVLTPAPSATALAGGSPAGA